MKNQLHQEGNKPHLKILQKEEAQELATIEAATFGERLKKIAKIKYKYYLLRRDTKWNNYVKNDPTKLSLLKQKHAR